MQCIRCKKEIPDESAYCNWCGKKQVVQKRRYSSRRANRTGCVRKLSGNRRKPWFAFITYMGDDGVRKQVSVGYYETKAAAELELTQAVGNPLSDKANIKFSELYNEWSESHFKNISKSLQDNYRASYNHLKPIHGMRFRDIRTNDIMRIIENSIAIPNSKELSHSSKTKIKILCGLLYKYAMENDICNKNYAAFIRLKRPQKAKREIFSDLEIQRLRNNDSLLGADLVLILLYTGFRIQELLNLTKFDVDLKEKIITGGLKTENGINRVVPIHPSIMRYILKYYEASGGLLFTNPVTGGILTQDYFRKKIYYPLLEELEIPKKVPHSTRGTFATKLSQNGADHKAIEDILGHSDYAFTADNYISTDVKYLTENINKIY